MLELKFERFNCKIMFYNNIVHFIVVLYNCLLTFIRPRLNHLHVMCKRYCKLFSLWSVIVIIIVI